MRSLSRRERIVVLLRTYRDAAETLQRGDAGGRFQPGSRTLSMPDAWTDGGYPELERALRLLARLDRKAWWHVVHRYLRSTSTTRDVTRRGEKLLNVSENEIVRSEVIPLGEERKRRQPSADARKSLVTYRAVVERWDTRVDVCSAGACDGRAKEPCCEVERAVRLLSRLYRGEPRLADGIYWNVAA